MHSTFALHILHCTSGPNHPYPSGSSGMSKWSPNGSFTCHWPHPGSCLWRPSRLHLLCRFACCAAVERRGLKLWSVRVPRAENAWAGLPVIGVPCALKTIFALTKLTNLCRNVLNVLTCVHQGQNIQRTWVRHSSAMCDLSCSTSVLAHVVY